MDLSFPPGFQDMLSFGLVEALLGPPLPTLFPGSRDTKRRVCVQVTASTLPPRRAGKTACLNRSRGEHGLALSYSL
jgi:hypothetical protein